MTIDFFFSQLFWWLWYIKTEKVEKRDKTRQDNNNKYTGSRDDDSSSKNPPDVAGYGLKCIESKNFEKTNFLK